MLCGLGAAVLSHIPTSTATVKRLIVKRPIKRYI
jgi:hypothetical protein